MPIVVTERIESRRLVASRDGKASTFDLSLTVVGSMNETAVKSAASAYAPEVWGVGTPILWKQSVSVSCVGDSLWEAVVHYDTSAPEPLSANDSFEFDFGGGQKHITKSLATTAYPSSLPDNLGAIGVQDGSVGGADIYVPDMTFTETHYFGELAPAYKRLLFELRGRVNDAGFRGWDAGEVLFVGVSARRQDNRFETPWSVSYRFQVQPNEVVNIAGIEIPKLGWQLIDIRYEKQAGATSIVTPATGAYVHTVYQTANFSLLGIGV